MAPNFKKLKDTYAPYLSEAAIATVQLNDFNPDTIIKSVNYENLISENSEDYITVETLEPIASGTGEFLIKGYISQTTAQQEYESNVDYLITEKTNSLNEPLFYEYQLKFDAYGLTNTDLVEVYKNNIELVPPSKYRLEYGEDTFKNRYITMPDDTHVGRYDSNLEWSAFKPGEVEHRIRLLFPLEFADENAFYTVRYVKRLFDVNHPTHTELVELDRLYGGELNSPFTGTNHKPFSYEINYNKLILDTDVIPSENINFLYIVRNPENQIKQNGLVQLLTDGSQKEADASWSLRIQTGTFITGDAVFDEVTSKYQISYEGEEQYKYQMMAYIKPNRIGNNIYKINQNPFYVNSEKYVYPYYNIDVPYTIDGNDLPHGSVGFDLDALLLRDVKISSIDRTKGFLLFNKPIPNDKDFSMFLYVDVTRNIYIRNFEFNPRIRDIYGTNSDSSVSIQDVGIAIRRTREPITGNDRTVYFSPYFFDYKNPTKFYRASVVPTSVARSPVDGALNWNPYTSGADPEGEFIPIALFTLNELSPDVLKITDARTINGGIKDSAKPDLSNHQENSYTDIGYYDGELLPHIGMIIVHLPRIIYTDLVKRWIDSDMFNPELYTDITTYEIEQFMDGSDEKEYYNNLLMGLATTGDPVSDPYTRMLIHWAEKEASQYLDKLIKKYIACGSQYILMDENFKQIKLRME